AALRFASENRADFHAFDTGGLNGGGQVFGDLGVDGDNVVAFVVKLVFERDAADDTIAQRLDDFARFDDRLNVDAVGSSAIVFSDDHVLGHVTEAAGQISG